MQDHMDIQWRLSTNGMVDIMYVYTYIYVHIDMYSHACAIQTCVYSPNVGRNETQLSQI